MSDLELIPTLRSLAYNPSSATDLGHDISNAVTGEPILYVAKPGVLSADLHTVEEELGFELPSTLKDIYVEVGNGGFGPGYGVYGAKEAAAQYRQEARTYAPLAGIAWPAGLLPIVNWGCGISSAIDCTRPQAPVIRYDPAMLEFATQLPVLFGARYVGPALVLERDSLEAWLWAWIDGEDLFESVTP